MQGLIDQSENLQSLFNDRDPDIIGDKLIAGFDEITNLVITKKRIQVCNRGAKFWSKLLENERKTVAGLNTQAIRTRNPEDFRFYKNKKNTHTRNIIKYQKQKIRENFAKAKTRWKTFDQIIPQDNSTPKQIKYKGKVISSAREIANSYHEYLDVKLEDLRRQIKQTNFKAMKIFRGRITRVEDDMVLAPATIKEARMIIRKMKPSNSRGDSEITGRIIKQVSQYTSVAITHLANCVFTTGRFPAAFKTARILPLKKRGKPEDDFSGFRPINCLNPLSKILEEMIRVRIENHLMKNKILPRNQHGSRHGHSTITAVQQVETVLKKNKSKNKTSVILSTDLSNAFDTIDHALLLEKFHHIGVRGKPYMVIQSYLTDRKAFVEVQGYKGETKQCRPYSVIQGGKLSGQFFGVYTLETTKIEEIIRNPVEYKFITGEESLTTN